MGALVPPTPGSHTHTHRAPMTRALSPPAQICQTRRSGYAHRARRPSPCPSCVPPLRSGACVCGTTRFWASTKGMPLPRGWPRCWGSRALASCARRTTSDGRVTASALPAADALCLCTLPRAPCPSLNQRQLLRGKHAAPTPLCVRICANGTWSKGRFIAGTRRVANTLLSLMVSRCYSPRRWLL